MYTTSNIFDIGGFIIDLRVGRFSPPLAKMMLEKLGYTMTPPNTQYWSARGVRPRSPVYSYKFMGETCSMYKWNRHHAIDAVLNKRTPATNWNRGAIPFYRHKFMGAPCITWLQWIVHRAIDAFQNGMAPSTHSWNRSALTLKKIRAAKDPTPCIARLIG